MTSVSYPTPEHKASAEAIVEHFSQWPEIRAVLLTCSCARGKATKDSCLDIAALISPGLSQGQKETLEHRWENVRISDKTIQALKNVGMYSFVDMEFFDGDFHPSRHGWTSGPDGFELEIGNTLVYSVPLWERDDSFLTIRQRWLPYYSETMRQERLEMVLRCCLNNLDHISLYIERELYFQSFHRLWHAFGEFMQALFIARRTYPIAYDKWIKEQIVDILGLPELYEKLPCLFQINQFEGHEIANRGQDLRRLVDDYILNP
jgi:hypothetical protein